ncbi:hypothetical protein C8A01DRAFT_47552 [Parachaetomium inaequale]|uniref:Uncharacterized protein n=1 Tax=Parachaetomium inaequale TaxID=2588326 RepID=A0AAN6PDI2_9PEZI|nr:hypothetical protein C8A01DRAFT_47552 [Parachaetomium inaequale]
MKALTTAVALLFPDDETDTTTTTPIPSLPTAPACAAVTATRELCTTCVIPACLAVSTITQSCGCPTPVPTVHLDFPCASGCDGLWCSTSYAIVTAAGCVTDGPSPTTESTTTTFAPNGTVTTASPTSSSSIATNAAGRLRAPFILW